MGLVKVDAHHGKPSRIGAAALVASMALIAQTLCACSELPQSASAASTSSRYLDLNQPPPNGGLSADQAAQAKAGLTTARDNSQRAAVQGQMLH